MSVDEIYPEAPANPRAAATSLIDYKPMPNKAPMTEPQKRLLSWNFAVRNLNKHSYAGSVPEKEITKRRAKNKVARKSRRRNHG